MKQKAGLKRTVGLAYAVVCVLFLAFAVYMCLGEHSRVYQARPLRSYDVISRYTVSEISDKTAPVGVRKQYRFSLGNLDTNDNSLAFYVVHQYVEVRFDDELVYSLTPGENNRVGASPGSNWVIVPVHPLDSGRTVTVTLTPVYRDVINKAVDFELGSRFAIMTHCLKKDLPQLVLSVLCLMVGLLLTVAQAWLLFRRKNKAWDIFYLGHLSLLLGVWRITDTRFSAMLFGDNPMALGYITLAAMFVGGIPLLLFVAQGCTGRAKTILQLLALGNCMVALAVLMCQVCGWVEFHEILVVSHVLLAVGLLSMLVLLITQGKQHFHQNHDILILLVLMGLGIAADLINYYTTGTSAGVLYSIVAFLLYALWRFISSLVNINRRAYTDLHTGLRNRSYWNRLMDDPAPMTDTVGMMMLDLNRLKHVNDTMGHKAGDQMIIAFADILKKTIPAGNAICRWGGDEFAVLLPETSRPQMEQLRTAIAQAVEAYNASGKGPAIHFAAGCAFSGDYPGISRRELLEQADERMYRRKDEWYRENRADNSDQ